MSCRSTPGGRAVSAAATALTRRSADDASRLIHALRHEYTGEDAESPASVEDTVTVLQSMMFRTAQIARVGQARKATAVAKLSTALVHVASTGETPSKATLHAWEQLPAAMELEAAADHPPYHKRFARFHPRTLEATDALFSARPSRLTEEERDQAFRTWVKQASEVYGMEEPTFHWDVAADGGGGGFYRPSDHSITMSPNHPSVTTLLHEFRHALQHQQKGPGMVDEDVEVDARAWSLSLYYQVRPRLFAKLVREGRLFHIDPADLDD